MAQIGEWNPWDQTPSPLSEEENEQLPQEDIPTDPQLFYEWVGLIRHPRTGELVPKLAPWQYDSWKAGFYYKRRLEVKSQKVGGSFSALEEDFQRALTNCKGKDILVVSQTQYHADEHLLKLKTRIINSKNARKYLITEPSELLFREQKTKVKIATIKNPDNPLQPTRIIALGMAESGMWSWSNVGHIHMSDPTVAQIKDDAPLFAAAFSRLANTDGTMLIETPPRGTHGQTFELYNQYLPKQQALSERDFKIFHVTAQDGVKEGLITQEFLDEEKMRLGALYPQYYMAEFMSVGGNLFAQSAIDKAIAPLIDIRENTEKYCAVDLGYSSSRFGILIGEWDPKLKKIRILVAEQIQSPQYEQMIERILRYNNEYKNIQNILVDATSRMEFCMSLKTRLGEENDWNRIKKKMQDYKSKGWDLNKAMKIVPVLFNLESKGFMASHTRQILEDPREFFAIDPKFNDLIISLRSAVFDDRGVLDKEMSPNNDLLDCFMMFCTCFKFRHRDK
jgi:uncharacterized protein (UPF0335 family)